MASPSKQLKRDGFENPEGAHQVLPLSASVLTIVDANTLLNYLLITPNSSNASDAIKKLCTEHDFKYIFCYLHSLPYDHWHRPVMKKALMKRFNDMATDDLYQLGKQFIPLKSAWTDIDGESVEIMGPLTNLETAAWDTIDWFFQMLHSRRMEGEHTLLFDIPLPMYIKARVHFEAE